LSISEISVCVFAVIMWQWHS